MREEEERLRLEEEERERKIEEAQKAKEEAVRTWETRNCSWLRHSTQAYA